MQTTSGLRALTEATAQEDTLLAPSASDGDPVAEQQEDTLQLGPTLLRRVAPKPVFVDASGRNRRRFRILVAALVIPVVAYVALLISTLVGGPAIPSALLPRFAAPAQASAAPTPVRQKPHKSQAPHRSTGVRTAAAGLKAKKARPSSSASAAPSLSPSPSPSRTTNKGKPKPTASPSASTTPRPKPTLTILPGGSAG